MKYRALVVGGLAAVLAAVPILSARAWDDRPYYYGSPPVYYSNPLLWPFQAAAAVVVGAVTLATLPFRVIAGATYPYPAYYGAPAYYPRPAYYPPSSGYYPPAPGYYPPQQAYSPQRGSYPQQQGYYPPQQQGYYAPPGATITPR